MNECMPMLCLHSFLEKKLLKSIKARQFHSINYMNYHIICSKCPLLADTYTCSNCNTAHKLDNPVEVGWTGDHSSLAMTSWQLDLLKLETVKTITLRKMNTILLSIKINISKPLSVCGYKLAQFNRNILSLSANTAVLGRLPFWLTL